jgi:holin-like protein
MDVNRIRIACRRYCRLHCQLQVLIFLGFWLLGEGLVRATGIQIPGSIAGLVIVLVLLHSKRISIRTVRRGAQWFLAEMLLFFIPAVLAILNYPEFLKLQGLKILGVILLSTLIVMIVTGATIDLCYRYGKNHVDFPK